MPNTKKTSPIYLLGCALLLALLGACATPTRPDVGAVVLPPAPQLPPPPTLVQTTQPLPTGYFQQSLLNFFSSKPPKPTPSTMPTPAAAPTALP